MSEENVEIVRRGYEAYGRGDLHAWLKTIDPDIRWDISTYPLPIFRRRAAVARRLSRHSWGRIRAAGTSTSLNSRK